MSGYLSEKKKLQPPKCFNIASRVGRSSTEQPLSCRVHPVAIMRILDAYVRRPENSKRTIGTLLGWISEGSVVDITDSFPVGHKDTEEETLMDQLYHNQMLELRQKVSPREVVVGWFSTGEEINASSAVIHGFYQTKEAKFNPTAVLSGPLHLLVDTSLSQGTMGIKISAHVNVRTTMADSLLQFHEVPLSIQTTPGERSGISQLMQARRAARGTANKDADEKEKAQQSSIGSLDGFEGGLNELLALCRQVKEYVGAVRKGTREADLAVGRGLTAAICSEPVVDVEAVENLCNSSLQDALMVVYLSNLTKTQISIAEKVNAQFNMPEA